MSIDTPEYLGSEPKQDTLVYDVLMVLRDTGTHPRQLEVSIMKHNDRPHPADSPHMIMCEYLRRNWNLMCAAAEQEHMLRTAAAAKDKIDEQGGLAHMAGGKLQ